MFRKRSALQQGARCCTTVRLDGTGDTEQLAEIYDELGTINQRLRRPGEAEKYYKLSLQVYERLGDQSKYAYAIIDGLADLYSDPMVYRIQEAMHLYQEAEDVLEKGGDKLGVARCKLEMAHALRLWGEMDNAIQLYQACAEEFERLEEPWLQIISMRFWGYSLRDTDHFPEAIPILEKALGLAQENHSETHQFYVLLYGLAWVAIFQRKFHRAEELVGDAMKIAKRLAAPSFMADVYLDGLGYIFLYQRKFPKGAQNIIMSDEIMDEEYRLHLSILVRFVVSWAKSIGRHTENNWIARIISDFIWLLYYSYHRLNNPSHWFGRQLWRLVWWLHRF